MIGCEVAISNHKRSWGLFGSYMKVLAKYPGRLKVMNRCWFLEKEQENGKNTMVPL